MATVTFDNNEVTGLDFLGGELQMIDSSIFEVFVRAERTMTHGIFGIQKISFSHGDFDPAGTLSMEVRGVSFYFDRPAIVVYKIRGGEAKFANLGLAEKCEHCDQYVLAQDLSHNEMTGLAVCEDCDLELFEPEPPLCVDPHDPWTCKGCYEGSPSST